MRNQLRLLRDVSALTLIACTWRLWFAKSDFPAVPFFEFLTTAPRVADQILSCVLVVTLAVNCCLSIRRFASDNVAEGSARFEHCCDLVFAISAGGLILLNQHCLQPWMYHFLILIPLLWQNTPQATASNLSVSHIKNANSSDEVFGVSRLAIIWLTASIYAWSAWSKLDASFLQSHGPKFVSALCDVAGISTTFWTDQTWRVLSATLPLGELLMGALLLFRKTRRLGLATSLVMHLLLMIAVGPWGLNHEAGVLLWNAFFIIQNTIFLLAERRTSATVGLPGSENSSGVINAGQSSSGIRRRLSVVVLVAAILLPGLRSVGWCDTWPAWAVYASSPARVLVQVRDDAVHNLPKSLHSYVERRQVADGWSWLRIEKWSLDVTGTPIYPEDRFQLAVALTLMQASDFTERIRIVYQAEANRWNGERSFQHIDDPQAFAARFTLGTLPR